MNPDYRQRSNEHLLSVFLNLPVLLHEVVIIETFHNSDWKFCILCILQQKKQKKPFSMNGKRLAMCQLAVCCPEELSDV